MAAESVSFRITRTTEDLAQTVAALSQRLVRLEQRLDVIALQLDQLSLPVEADAEQVRRLDDVAVLLADCRQLLDDSNQPAQADWSSHDGDQPMAA